MSLVVERSKVPIGRRTRAGAKGVWARLATGWMWSAVAAAVLMVPSCGTHESAPPPDDDPINGHLPKSDGGSSSATSCATPQEGCACETEGETIDCGQVDRRSGSYVSCSLGTRTCTRNYWSACSNDRVAAPFDMSSRAPLAFGPSAACINNPCDPYCINYVDNATGLDAGDPLAVADAGLTLQGHLAATQSVCTGIQIVDNPQTITVTSFSPLTTSPAHLYFKAQLVPVGCALGFITATWALSDYDSAAIDKNGQFDVYTPVALTENVTGYAGSWQGTATAQVLVKVKQVSSAPAGTASIFDGTPSVADNATLLYPYNNTVFPRGIKAPVLQWDNNGTAAAAVKVSVRYPATGTPLFDYSQVIAESNPPQATIPQSVWSGLDQTAKGQDALIVLQREVGGVLRNEITRTVHFSTTPLRGQIYYTEYGRGPSVPGPTPSVGGVCNAPLAASVIRSLDPTGNSAPVNPFATVAPGGCPVCHSVAANGKMFVTSDRGWGSGGGVSRINSDGTFTPIADSPQPPKPGVDSRGFAYGAITPDGQYVLQGSNLWGNTVVAGSTGGARLSAGNGNGLYADYFNNKTLSGSPALRRIDQTVNFDWGTGSPAVGVLPDGFSVRWSGKVQPLATEQVTFETTSQDGVRLWVDNTLIIDKFNVQSSTVWRGSINLIAGKKYDIKLEYFDDTGAAAAALRWSGPTVPLQIIPLTQLYAR